MSEGLVKYARERLEEAEKSMRSASDEERARLRVTCDLAKILIEELERPRLSLVTVSGGVAEVAQEAPGCSVEIIDYDNLKEDEEENGVDYNSGWRALSDEAREYVRADDPKLATHLDALHPELLPK